jgi:GTP pyrophosphokinase
LPEHPQKLLKEKKSDNIIFRYVKHAFNVGGSSKEDPEKADKDISAAIDLSKIDKKKTYILKEEDFQKNFITQACCSPIPGDEVFGFIRDDGRLEIHKRSCQPALTLKTRYGDRIISCDWAGHKTFSFPSTIEVKGIDRMGILNDITQVITNDLSVNMRKLTIESNDGFFEGRIEVAIHDVDDLNKLSNRLQKIKGVKNVVRVVD